MDPTIKDIIISDKQSDIKLSEILESFSSNNSISQVTEDIQISNKNVNNNIVCQNNNLVDAIKNSNPFRNIGKSIFSNKSSMKLINIMRVFDLVKNNKSEITWVAVNDAPGGFANALKYLYFNSKGILLSSIKENNKWNIDLSKFNVFGNNNSADIVTDMNNFIDYVNLKSDYKGVDIYTSYDKTNDFKIILTEVLTALKTLKLGGIMIIRLYDSSSEIYKQLLLLISLKFLSIFIFKPITTNPSNDERYLIAIAKTDNNKFVENILINAYNKNNNINNLIRYDKDNKYVMDFNNWIDKVNKFLLEEKEFYYNKAIDYLNNKALNYPIIDVFKIFTLWDIPDNNYHIHKKIKMLNLDDINIDIISFLPITNLKEEYDRWLTIKEIWNTFLKLSNNSKIKYEIIVIIIRFLLWVFNYPNEYIKARDKAISELKNIKVDIDSLSFDKIMSKKITNNKDNIEEIINYDTGDIRYGLYKNNLDINILRNLLIKNNNHQDLIQLLLRYDNIRPDSGLFWSIPPNVYKYLNDVVKVDYEAFANPIYHNLENYFSPFNDIDKKYGSLGSFYDNELLEGKYVVNPPYSENLLILTTNKILNTLANGKGNYDFFVYYPNWYDSIALINLLKSSYMKNSRVMNNNYIYDLTKNLYINPKFDSVFIYLSNYNNPNIDFNTIVNKFFINK